MVKFEHNSLPGTHIAHAKVDLPKEKGSLAIIEQESGGSAMLFLESEKESKEVFLRKVDNKEH